MRKSLSPEDTREVMASLQKANASFARRYPGDTGQRQPVHTVYGGAHLFKADAANRLGTLALRSLEHYAPDPFVFAKAIGLPGCDRLPGSLEQAPGLKERLISRPDSVRSENRPAWLACILYTRVREKLRTNQWRISALISRTATGTDPMLRKTATRPRPREKLLRGWLPAAYRPSSASASNLCLKTPVRAVCR
ncbi:MAG: hypothetical protein HY652_11240 [Acidobacteria bacterium]|nr:hypothetical protein [Acidobacteriota bacterium]